KVLFAICTSSTEAAAEERRVDGSAEEARSSADNADCESLNEPTWITQVPIDGEGGALPSAGRGTTGPATRCSTVAGCAGGGAGTDGAAGSALATASRGVVSGIATVPSKLVAE